MTFTVTGFGGGTTVTVTLMSPASVVLGTITAYYDGIGVLTVKIPVDTQLGDHAVSATGVDPNGKSLTVSTLLGVAVRVAALKLASAGAGGVAADAVGPVVLTAIVGGSLLVVAMRKRRAGTAHPATG